MEVEAQQAQLEFVPEAAENGHVPDEVEVAKGEVLDDAKIVNWEGLALTVPAKLPASFVFDMTEAEIGGDDTASSSYAVHTVYKLLGKEQWAKAKNHADELGLSADDFGDFINAVYREYGFGGPGESSESSNSQEEGGAA